MTASDVRFMDMTDIRRALKLAQYAESGITLRHEELAALINALDNTRAELARVQAKSEERKAILENISVGDACGWCGIIQIFGRDDTERKPQHRDDCPLAKALED